MAATKLTTSDLCQASIDTINNLQLPWGELINVNKLPVGFEENAVKESIKHIFEEHQRILKIAAGLAIVKDNACVTKETLRQAIEMHKKGMETYLPNLDWD